MANRVPLILNTSSNQIQELPTGDNLDLSNSGIHNAGVITATSFTGDGSALTGLTAAGTGAIGGLTVKDEGSVVGTAGSISSFDFRGSYITATANTGAAGVTTVTLSETPTFSAVTVTNNINANGRIVGAATSNVIPFLYSNYSDLPSAATYHGAFAHVHATQKAYYAHGGNWIELVNKDTNGNIVGTNATFSGNVSIGGTLTYEDVTNVDAVGLITARSGVNISGGELKVGTGVTVGQAGIVSATGFCGHVKTDDGAGNVLIPGATSGSSSQLYNTFLYNSNGQAILTPTAGSEHFAGDSDGFTAGNASNLNAGTVPTVRLGSGTANSSSFLRGDQTWAAVTSTTINNNADNRLITGSGTANTLEAESTLTFDSNGLKIHGSKKLYFGDSGTFQMNFSTHTFIEHTSASGTFYIQGDTLKITNKDRDEIYIECDDEAGVKLKYANTTRCETTSTGVSVTGTVAATAFTGDGSALTGITGTTINNNADNRIITGSGTANTLNGEANFTFDGTNLVLAEGVEIKMGTSSNLEIISISGNKARIQSQQEDLYIETAASKSIILKTNRNGTYAGWSINADGDLIPSADSTVDIGTNTVRVQNFYADTLYGDGSNLTGITGTTINNNADNRVITGSGTANTLEGESTFTYDGSALKVKSTHSLASYVQRTDGVWGNWSPEFNFKATGASPAGTTFGQWGNHAEGHQIVFVKSRNNGTSGTTCQAGDDLGSIFWSPYNSANPGCAAAVKVMASGAYSSTSNPAYMQIMTTPDGSKEPTERVRIGSHGGVIFKGGPLQEKVKITAGKLSNNTNIDLADGNVHYFTTQESTTSTPNLRVNSTIMLNSVMEVGETVAVTLITTAAAGGYSAALQIHGNTQTVNWVGGSAPSAGGSSGVDIYNYTIIKTGSSAFTVIGNLTKTS